jgi:hypothetical protein
MLSCAVVVAALGVGVGVVGIHAGSGAAHDVGGFVTGRVAVASWCIRSIAQPAKPIATETTPVYAKSTAARPHVRPHDWRNGSVSGSSFDQAWAASASVGGGNRSVSSFRPMPAEVRALSALLSSDFTPCLLRR